MSIKIQDLVTEFVRSRSNDKIPHVEFNGKPIRFGAADKRQRFFFVGFTNIEEGSPFFGGYIMDWVSGEEKRFLDKNEELFKVSPKYRKAIYRASVVSKKIEEKSFNEFFKVLNDSESHPYLVQKGVKGYGVKELDDALLVPATSFKTGNITGYQMIFDKKLSEMGKDKITVGGKEIWCKGMSRNKHNVGSLKNTYHQIGDLTDNIYICEGYATAATIHQQTDCMTVSTFGSNLILEAAKYFATKYEDRKIFIVLDTDCLIPPKPKEPVKELKEGEEEKKPPKSFYENLQIKLKNVDCINIFIILPDFKSDFNVGTDFNDLYAVDPEDCKKQIIEKSKIEDHVIVLGGDGTRVWFQSDRKGLVDMPFALKAEELYGRVASSHYWDSLSSSHNVVKKKILNSSLRKNFDVTKIKKAGVYRDEGGDVVINTGGKIIGKPRDGFVYLKNGFNDSYRHPDPREYKHDPIAYSSFVSDITKLNFKEDMMAYDLIIWLAMATVFGAQSFITHLLLQGLSGTGKTWVLREIVIPYLKSFKLHKMSKSSTFPAFSRKVHLSPAVFTFDEREFDEGKEKDLEFLTAFRQVSTDKDDVIEKADGAGLKIYKFDFVAVLASIKPIIYKEEDKARFIHVVFKRKRFNETNKKAITDLRNMDLNKIGLGIYSHCFENWKEIETLANDFYNEMTGRYQIQGHSAKKLGYMLAFCKVLKLFNEEKFNEYKSYLINKASLDARNVAEELVDQIVNSQYDKSEDSLYDIISRGYTLELDRLARAGVMYKDGALYLSRKSAAVNQRIFGRFGGEKNTWFNILRAEYQDSKARFCGVGFTRGVNETVCVIIPYKIEVHEEEKEKDKKPHEYPRQY